MDQIRIKGLEIFAHHGVYPEEKEKGQHFFLDAVLYTDTRRAGLTDRLELSTDYGEVCRLMNEVMCAQTYDLIERAAEQTAQEVLLAFPLIRRLELELPEAFCAWPGELVQVQGSQPVGRGLWRVAESVCALEETGRYTRLSLCPPDTAL